jgi:hypothetical protein
MKVSAEPFKSIDLSGLTATELVNLERAVQDNTDAVSARRQNMNVVFVGFNTVALTGLGAALITTQVSFARVVLLMMGLTVVTVLLNLIWLRSVQSYNVYVGARVRYMQRIEEELQQRWGKDFHGIFQVIYPTYRGFPTGGTVDVRLVWFFILLYPTITTLALVVTFLIGQKLIPPIP